ncbi:hypothetical protein Airi01_075790 [Actinoallomurus iriomotensis]|uniref:Uncharacterized protein n=1 Tax=Actinoallomurus iriomotensis TaxID=478107 RepID=A0A9W6VU88_9ACTN|nr:hypothetical protein Airi01_075790 [Actinoallomurus iriomotensis]
MTSDGLHRRLHDELAALVAALGVPPERLFAALVNGQAVGEDDAVLDRLGRSLAQVRGRGHPIGADEDPVHPKIASRRASGTAGEYG